MHRYLTAVYDADWRSVVKGRPALTQELIDRSACKSFVVAEQDFAYTDGFPRLQIGRIWVLRTGATLGRLPARERMAARAVLRSGQAILLLAPDSRTEADVRKSLLNLIEVDGVGDALFGHA